MEYHFKATLTVLTHVLKIAQPIIIDARVPVGNRSAFEIRVDCSAIRPARYERNDRA